MMLLSATHLLVFSGSCSFRPYPFNRSVMSFFFKYPLILSSLIPSIYRWSAVQIISFLFLPYLVLTGVLCPFAQALSFYQVFHLFSTEVLSEFVIPCSSPSIPFHSFISSGGFLMLLSSTRVLRPFAQALSFYQVFHLFSTGVLPESVLSFPLF